MPSGVYPRKPRGEAVTDATIEPKPGPKRKAPSAKKPAKKRAGVTLVSSKRASGQATFVVNDVGAMGILAGQKRIDLEPGDVKRLEQFLTNSKGLRR